ncbi:MAG: deaminase [Kangiellaceae bacterium]|nr:deaminase [Kangiellaceae bacterium]
MTRSIYANLKIILALLVPLFISSCVITNVETQIDPKQREIDKVFTMLAFAVVYKDWQKDGAINPRGHNIGSVLVDRNNKPVFWARNANAITNNGSQHGEVRLIHNYLQCSSDKYLVDYTVYTTLEPCAMCTGMMSLTQLSRAVYGQKDPGFGDVLERLALDSSKLQEGHKPYPRVFDSDKAVTKYTSRLESLYKDSGLDNITQFLRLPSAEEVFKSAQSDLLAMKPAVLNFPESKQALIEAKKYYESVSAQYVEDVKSLCKK